MGAGGVKLPLQASRANNRSVSGLEFSLSDEKTSIQFVGTHFQDLRILLEEFGR